MIEITYSLPRTHACCGLLAHLLVIPRPDLKHGHLTPLQFSEHGTELAKNGHELCLPYFPDYKLHLFRNCQM